ncbi:hypothetical protein [Methanopyrus sp.]
MADKVRILSVVLCMIYGYRVADEVFEVSEPLSSRWHGCSEDLAVMKTVEELGKSLDWGPEVMRRWRSCGLSGASVPSGYC